MNPPIKRFVEHPMLGKIRGSKDIKTQLFEEEYDRLLKHHEEETTWLFGRARELLEKTAAAPAMYASTKEVFIMRVATVLELHVKDFDVEAFYKKHVEMRGSAYVGLDDAPGLDWPRRVVTNALVMLG